MEIEPQDGEESNLMRGLVNGLLLAIPFWVAFGLLVWWILVELSQ